jgi:hypothetical protein
VAALGRGVLTAATTATGALIEGTRAARFNDLGPRSQNGEAVTGPCLAKTFRSVDGEDFGVVDEPVDHDGGAGGVADHFDTAFAAADSAVGLSLYRDLARFIAGYLPHLHEEENRAVQSRPHRRSVLVSRE